MKTQEQISMIEIHFNRAGNTVIGDYSVYAALDRAIEAKHVFRPFGWIVTGTPADISRLSEHVALFGNCIKTLTGFRRACELAGCILTEQNNTPASVCGLCRGFGKFKEYGEEWPCPACQPQPA